MSISIDTYCLQCLLRRNIALAQTLGTEEQAIAFAKEIMKLYLAAPEGVSSPWFGPQIADLLHDMYGLDYDRFRQEKLDSNHFVLERLPMIRKRVTEAKDPVLAGLQFAILGNYLDFSALQGQVSFEKLEEMLDKALEMGADYAINGREEDTLARVMELTGGMGAHIVFETAGNRVTAAQTESLTRRGGTIVIVGNVMGDTPMNFYKIAHKELVIKTVHRYRNVFPLAIQAISDGKIDIEKIASDCFDFDNGIAAFEKSLCEKQAVVKAILKME